jgi:hypothetical protein
MAQVASMTKPSYSGAYVILAGLCFGVMPPKAQAQLCNTGNSGCVGGDCAPTIDQGYKLVECAFGDTTDGREFGSFRREIYNVAGNKSGGVYDSAAGVTFFGRIESNTNTTYIRAGSTSFKHSVWTSSTYPTMRAELNDLAMGLHALKDSQSRPYDYWYGFSFFIPSNNDRWNAASTIQYISQWRYQNTSGCVESKTCSGAALSGSGHALLYDKGRLRFALKPQDSSCNNLPRRTKEINLDLGACPKGQWVDVVIRALWTPSSNGRMAIWVQRNNGGYVVAANYSGPTWVDQYGPTCGYGLANDAVSAPNWMVGLYYGNDYGTNTGSTYANPRILYTDSLRMNRTLCAGAFQGSEAWNRTAPVP